MVFASSGCQARAMVHLRQTGTRWEGRGTSVDKRVRLGSERRSYGQLLLLTLAFGHPQKGASARETLGNWCWSIVRWLFSVTAFVGGTAAALWLIDALHLRELGVQVAIVVLMSDASMIVPVVLMACGLLLAAWIEVRWGDSVITHLSILLIALLYAGTFLIAIGLAVFVLPRYLRVHPAHDWIIEGSIITGLSIQLIAVLVGVLPTSAKGAPPAATYAVLRCQMERWLRQRHRDQARANTKASRT
jgi:hypothetical protein